MLSERRASFRPQPKGTVPYEVQATDSLEGISARYNITPSELCSLNKLSARCVFPGQIIYIPEKNSLQNLENILKISAAAVNEASDGESPKPGHVERIPSSVDEKKEQSATDQTGVGKKFADFKLKVEDLTRESLRINSKYVTDGEGVVSGVLIVTRNHAIFDPNVSDPLVIEYGMDKYGVEAPMSCIVRAALYTDIFRIRQDASTEKNTLYHSKNLPMRKSKSDEKFSKNDKSKYNSGDVSNRRSEFGVTVSKSFQDSLSKINESAGAEDEENEDNSTQPSSPTPEEVNHSNESSNLTISDEHKNSVAKTVLSKSPSIESDDTPLSRKASMSDEESLALSTEAHSPKKKSSFEKTKHKLGKGLRKLSITESLFSNTSGGGRRMSLPAFSSLPDFKLKSPSVKSPSEKPPKPAVESEKSTGLAYVNMVDEKPELFAPLDKLIPRPATSFCDTPLYLCLRMGEPIEKSAVRSNPVVHFGQKMKPEYWFSIPKDSVDSLYCFFLRWCPEKYGDIDKVDFEELGFKNIEPEFKEQDEKVPRNTRRASWAFPWRRKSKDVAEMTATSSPDDWELLDYLGADTKTVHLPELLTPSTILSDDQLLEINKHLPARAMNAWTLIYGNSTHGFGLKTMYREMAKYDCPVLIVIANRNDAIFGALLSSPLKVSDHFYGTGESFLFTFCPEFKVFHWKGENDYFIKGNVNSFMIGSSEGHFGLWLDDDLFRGCTNSCQTFGNDPLCPEEDFEVKAVEVWGFV